MATPPPQLQPAASATHPNRRVEEQSAAEGVWTGLCPCRVTFAMCPQFPHPDSEAKLPWTPPPGLWPSSLNPRPQANSSPLPTRFPAAAPPAPTRATCDLRDERFRHQRHVGCEALRARLRSAAVRALPCEPSGSRPTQLTSLAGPRLRLAEPTSAAAAWSTRLPPRRQRTSGVAACARRHFRLLRPARSGPA